MKNRHEEMIKCLLSVLVVLVVSACILLSGCPPEPVLPPSPKPDADTKVFGKQEPIDQTDSDVDGVPDQLEMSGYFWKDGKFRLWDGDPNVTYYRTDPDQWSTDQDPYSDGMEVSRIKMDVSVAEPGNHPLVPAYPDIYVSMDGTRG